MPHRNFLLIDDDAEDQEIFQTAIETIVPGLTCRTMADGREALDLLRRQELKPDMIFLDLNMPIMTGQQFLREIKQHAQLAEIPVIVISTSSNPATIENAKALGAASFITKPSRFDALVTVLEPLIK